jgi:hypothetical protein
MGTKKITLNELRQIVKRIIKEENENFSVKNIEFAQPGRMIWDLRYINNNPVRFIVTVIDNGMTRELLYGIHIKKNRTSFEFENGGDYNADIVGISNDFKNNLITNSTLDEFKDEIVKNEITNWIVTQFD